MILSLIGGFMVGNGLWMLFSGVSPYPKEFAMMLVVAGTISFAIALATSGFLW